MPTLNTEDVDRMMMMVIIMMTSLDDDGCSMRSNREDHTVMFHVQHEE